MSTPRSTAKIEFPASLIDDEIGKVLQNNHHHGIKAGGRDEGFAEPEIKDGIFTLEDGEAPYGEMPDLEEMLVEKGIPFDRISTMDRNRRPELRVFRPGDRLRPEDIPGALDFDDSYLLDPDSDKPVVSVEVIREFLSIDDAGEMAASKIRRFLDDCFPAYPPLTDWVKEEN